MQSQEFLLLVQDMLRQQRSDVTVGDLLRVIDRIIEEDGE